jgi:MYXO-CTERM domain-containing protein
VDLSPPGAALTVTCAAVDPSASGISVPSAAGVADGTTPVHLTVAAVNTCGDPARGRPVAMATSLGTLGTPTGSTDAAGTHAFTLTSTQAGTASVTGTVGGTALLPASVTFNSPPPPPKSGGGGGCATGGGGTVPALALLGLALFGRIRWRRTRADGAARRRTEAVLRGALSKRS